MLNNDEQLREKINDFLRRKEAKYPELTHPAKREIAQRDLYRPNSYRWVHANGQ